MNFMLKVCRFYIPLTSKVIGEYMTVVDFIGNSLEIGDYVAISKKDQTNLVYGKIVKISTTKSGASSVGIETDGPFKIKNMVYRVPHNTIKLDKNIVAYKVLVT